MDWLNDMWSLVELSFGWLMVYYGKFILALGLLILIVYIIKYIIGIGGVGRVSSRKKSD